MLDLMAVLWALVAAAGIAFLGYAKQAVGQNPEDFKWEQALPTVILGAAIGVALALAGTPVSEATVMEQIGVYGFLTLAIESGLKIVYRWLGKVGAV